MIIMGSSKSPSMLHRTRPVARPAQLSEAISDDLRKRIARSEIKPGDRLPTEKVLGETFGVSRAVVREAIARLKADGLIETRQGSGAYVAQVPKSLNLRFWQGDGPAQAELRQVFELRAMVEGAVAELAARRRTKSDLSTMKRHLKAMDTALCDGIDGTEADDNFHIAIAAATRNAYVGRLVEFLGRHFSESRKLTWPGRPGTESLPREAQREHLALFDAIAAGDPDAARSCALQHLRGAASRVGVTLAVDLNELER
jgi:GntR family transcriptional repressor for pyruvate dehydrogenase complex